jgi:hypothetical protein
MDIQITDAQCIATRLLCHLSEKRSRIWSILVRTSHYTSHGYFSSISAIRIIRFRLSLHCFSQSALL